MASISMTMRLLLLRPYPIGISRTALPDKAIDLIDEASATIRVEMNSMPTELDQVTRRLMQLEIEEAALKKNPMMHRKTFRHFTRRIGGIA